MSKARINPPRRPWPRGSSELRTPTALTLASAATNGSADLAPESIATLAAELEVLQQSLDGYDVLEQLRHGGQGIVFKARQHGSNRVVAIKLQLDGPLATERQRIRFEREVEVVGRLRHPNVVTLYESGVVRGRHFFAMEFVDGHSIDDFVVLNDLAPGEIVRLIVKICAAVNYAHQNGIIHRDLSPANVLVGADGEPHIFDFGLAKDVAGPNSSLTGNIVGTLPYMSPEQAGGLDGRVDLRSDVYSLGVMLYALLADVFPYPVGGAVDAVRSSIISAEPIPLRQALALSQPDRALGTSQINRDLESVIAKALAKPKHERYQTAAAFADDLERFLAGDAVQARQFQPLYRIRKIARKHWVALSVAAAMTLTLLVSAVAVTSAWLHASAERDNARRAAQAAFDVFHLALTEIDESVTTLPGGAAVRERIFDQLEGQLPRIRTLANADRALAATAVQMLECQGDFAAAHGMRELARQHYAECVRAGLELSGHDPRMASETVVRAFEKLAHATPAGAAIYLRGIEFGERARAVGPDSAELRLALASIMLKYAAFLQSRDETTAALPWLGRVLALSPPTDVVSADSRWAEIVCAALRRQGRTLLCAGEGAAGLAALQASVELGERVAATSPSNTRARGGLLRSYAYLAQARADGGNARGTIELYERAARHGETLEMMDPGVTTWDDSRFLVHYELATLGFDTADPGLAGVHRATALALAERCLTLNPRDPAALQRWSFALILQGRTRLEAREFDAAQDLFSQAASIRDELAQADHGNVKALRGVAAAYYWLGSAIRKAGDAQCALAHAIRACELDRQILKFEPGSVQSMLGFVQSRLNLAAAHMAMNTAANDGIATRLLDEAACDLDDLEAGGRLIGREREYQRPLHAIRVNRAILEQRSATAETALNDQPAIPLLADQ